MSAHASLRLGDSRTLQRWLIAERVAGGAVLLSRRQPVEAGPRERRCREGAAVPAKRGRATLLISLMVSFELAINPQSRFVDPVGRVGVRHIRQASDL